MNLKSSLIAGIVTVFLAAGCSPETRYRTLSFFFDGVPLPGEEEASEGRRGFSADMATRPQKKEKGVYREHGPFAAKLCEACHLVREGNKLVLPVEELCFKCHNLNIKKKHVHGPVASGGCRVCHEPHGSGKAYLLVSDPGTFCFYCHDKVEVQGREVHQQAGDAQCTDCHSPHASDEEFMLK